MTFPAIMVILSKWTPPSERSRMTSFNFAGIMFGTVVSLAVTGALCEVSLSAGGALKPRSMLLQSPHLSLQTLGWESVFYVFGGIGILWFFLW